MAGLGLASLVLAQYRTGYGAFVVALLVYLLFGRRWLLATGVLMVVIGVDRDEPVYVRRASRALRAPGSNHGAGL